QLKNAAVDLAQPFEHHPNRAIGVFQVAISRHRADIDPFAEVRMAEEAVVMLIAIALYDRGLDFAADPADRADRRFGADARAGDQRPSANRRGPLDEREWLDLGRIDHDRAVARVEH